MHVTDKEVDRKWEVDQDDGQDCDDETTELGLRDSVAHTESPALVETLTTDPPMAEKDA